VGYSTTEKRTLLESHCQNIDDNIKSEKNENIVAVTYANFCTPAYEITLLQARGRLNFCSRGSL
jgi:hypothetical protein